MEDEIDGILVENCIVREMKKECFSHYDLAGNDGNMKEDQIDVGKWSDEDFLEYAFVGEDHKNRNSWFEERSFDDCNG